MNIVWPSQRESFASPDELRASPSTNSLQQWKTTRMDGKGMSRGACFRTRSIFSVLFGI